MNNLLSLKKNLLIAVLLDLTLLLLVLKLLMKVFLARTMLGSFLGLYILNGEQRSRAIEESKDLSFTSLDEFNRENESEDKTNDETCLMAQSSNEVTLDSSHYSDNASSLDDDRFDNSKASTSGTKPISFVGSSVENATDGSTIMVHESTIPGSVDPPSSQKLAEHVFSPPMSSRSDFVITRKKLIHNKIEESKKPSLKPSLKSGLGYRKSDV
ncbi:hypothetical protein Tco_0502228 [Tanacetum coccineum]